MSKTTEIQYPMTSYDLRAIANYVDKITRTFGEDGKYTSRGEPVTKLDIEICVPLSGGEAPVGRVIYYDGWVGFAPYAYGGE